MQIAIDGPAGSGKSTIAKIVAQKMGFTYIDTGAMYRGVTLYFLENHIEPEDLQEIMARLGQIRLDFKGGRMHLGERDISKDIRSPEINRRVSDFARIPEIRLALQRRQREIARNNSVVMDGRDIGTYVLPQAEVKVFLSASDEERARRRQRELLEKGFEASFEEILENLQKRDAIDSSRAHSPLKKAPEAHGIDTTRMSIAEVVAQIISIIEGVEPCSD